MPFHLARSGVEREHTIRVEVVSRAVTVIAVRPGIAGGPVKRVCRRVPGTRKPGRAATCNGLGASPGVDTGFAAARYRPSAPDESAVVSAEGCNKTPDTVVCAGHAGNHHVIHHQRRHGTPIVVAPIMVLIPGRV